MEARLLTNISADKVRAELMQIRDSKGRDGKGLAGVEAATGVSRSIISQMVNRGYIPDERKLEALALYLASEYCADIEEDAREEAAFPPPETGAPFIRRFGVGGRIYSTKDYARAFGMLDDYRQHYITCVMIGHPGTGKTTTLREYTRQRENTYYINCWPYMGTRDLLEAVAEAMGITLKAGSVMKCARQLMAELERRPGAMLIYDEAENLRGENAKKLDTLRKLCDDTPSSALFAGTPVLEAALTRGGNGPLNMAQITRRQWAIPMKGVSAEEVKEMLREYDVSEGARKGLIEIATDTKHGGMGNFVELLNICLNVTGGGAITDSIFRDARRCKLLY